MNLTKKTLLTVGLLALSSTLFAQMAVTLPALSPNKNERADSIELRGQIVDSFTREVVDSVYMELYSLPDSAFADTLYNEREHMTLWRGWEYPMTGFSTKVPQHGKYTLYAVKKGYKPLFYNFEIPRKRYNKKVHEWELDDLLLIKGAHLFNERDMDELTVTATKVKMVMAGDTVVFNANAFQLSEGSMLDELVRQLPGVEIRRGGEIYVNGNKVSELLVNGKDFFNGDAKKALDNLPAYVVQNIKAYQRESKHAYLDKHHESVKKKDPWVLDVNLKREYAKGWLGNVEGGYGWDDRYMGRIFAVRYTDHSRITAFANTNNTNNTSRPGSETSWADNSAPTNEMKILSGGIDMHVDDKVTKTEFNTSLNGNRTVTDSREESSSQTFLPSGDIFQRSRNTSHTKSGSLDWNGSVDFQKKELWANLNANLRFSRGRSNAQNRSATFARAPEDSQRGASLDSVFQGILPQKDSPRHMLQAQYAPAGSLRLLTFLTNRSEDLSRSENHNWGGALGGSLYTTAPWNGEDVHLSASANYSDAQNKNFSHYDLRQADAEGNGSFTQDFRNRYTESPSRSYNWNVSLGHTLFSLKDIFRVGLGYRYRNSWSRGQRDLYRLDELEGTDGSHPWGASTTYGIGRLPSTRDSLSLCVDAANTYHSISREQNHELSLYLMGGGEWGYYYLSGDLNRYNKREEDSRSAEAPLHARFNLFSVQASADVKGIRLGASYSQGAPGLNQMLKIRDDANPLNISLGNPDLRNTYQASYNLGYQHFQKESQRNWSAGASFNHGSAIGNATIYDRQTGVYTHQPRNVNGNWGSNAYGNFNLPLDKKQFLTLSNNINVSYNRSVDFSSDHPGASFAELPLSQVHNVGLTDWLELEYQKEEYRVSLNAEADYSHAESQRENFQTINTVDFSYGVSSSLKFKYGYALALDLTMHSRRGYEDRTMNDDNLVLNAALSKSFLKSRCLVLTVTGHDILQQLDNVMRSVNAQGRTETWYNTQPSYVLFTASYRLDMKPKKRTN